MKVQTWLAEHSLCLHLIRQVIRILAAMEAFSAIGSSLIPKLSAFWLTTYSGCRQPPQIPCRYVWKAEVSRTGFRLRPVRGVFSPGRTQRTVSLSRQIQRGRGRDPQAEGPVGDQGLPWRSKANSTILSRSIHALPLDPSAGLQANKRTWRSSYRVRWGWGADW